MKINITPYPHANGRETRSSTLGEEHSVKVFVNRVLWRIFGQKRTEVTGEWSRRHNEEFHNLYVSPNTIRVMRRAGYVARTGSMRN
jgi:hypothetical protein